MKKLTGGPVTLTTTTSELADAEIEKAALGTLSFVVSLFGKNCKIVDLTSQTTSHSAANHNSGHHSQTKSSKTSTKVETRQHETAQQPHKGLAL